MFRLFYQCLRTFGFYGLLIYLKLKLPGAKKIKIPGIPRAISLRKDPEDAYTFREIFMAREYDFKFPEDLMPEVIVDAGANIGLTSIFFANRFKDAMVYSIEPDERNFEQLKRNAAGYTNIIPVYGALWNREEMISLLDKGLGNRAYMVEGSGDGAIPGISIASLIEKYDITAIDILKIDIEGSEKELFAGNFDNWLPAIKCLIIELHDRMKSGCSKSVFSALSHYHFDATIRGENIMFINRANSSLRMTFK